MKLCGGEEQHRSLQGLQGFSLLQTPPSFLQKEHIFSFPLSLSDLKHFSPFSLDGKAQPLLWHYTTHGICPGRRSVGANLAVRSQSGC